MMGGTGSRMGSHKPKQFLEVGGIPVYEKILKLYSKTNFFDTICLICKNEWIEYLKKQLTNNDVINKNQIIIASGGETRSESVKNGLIKISEIGAESQDIVLIHDATHMYLDNENVDRLIKELTSVSAATIVTHVWDTVYQASIDCEKIDCTLTRKQIAVGASPEGFKFWLLKKIFIDEKHDINKYTSVGDFVLKMGYSVKAIWSNVTNIKMTFPGDLTVMKMIDNS